MITQYQKQKEKYELEAHRKAKNELIYLKFGLSEKKIDELLNRFTYTEILNGQIIDGKIVIKHLI